MKVKLMITKKQLQLNVHKHNLKIQIINHLNIYITKKHILMKPFMKSLKTQLKEKGYLTLKQIKGISKYLIRDFKQFNNSFEDMINYFSPIIKDIPNYEKPSSTLEPFMNDDEKQINSNNPPPITETPIKQLWSNI